MKFSRVYSNPNKELPNAVLTDRALDDQGYLWWHSGAYWSVEKQITKGKLFDVQGEPTLHQGENDDAAVTPRGKCWLKRAGTWQYEEDLGEGVEQSIKAESLVVLGNLTLPVVDGWVLLFHPIRKEQIVGRLKVFPISS